MGVLARASTLKGVPWGRSLHATTLDTSEGSEMSARIPARHTAATRSAAIRSQLTHPDIDADGHALEFGPVYFEYLHQVAGPHVTARYAAKREDGGWDRLTPAQRHHRRVTRPTAWAHPTRHTLDRATAMLPALLRARLDAFGL